MLTERDLDRAVLTAALQREYGLAVSAVRFILAGETAWCYQLTDEHGGWWFLKLTRPDAIEPARADSALRLGGVLAGLGLPVPRPQPTRAGGLWCWLEGLRVAVFEFIDGQPLSDRDLRVPEVAGQAARLVAEVHAATPALAVPIPFVETFEVWAEGLRHCLAELEPGAGGAGGLRGEARALVWPQRGALLGMLERVQALGHAARLRPEQRVLCHGDLIGDNLLRAPAGCGRLTGTAPRWLPANSISPCSPAGGSSASLTTTKATPKDMSWTRIWSPFSCCAATSTTWSTGWVGCSPVIGPTSSGAGTSTAWGGACRAGGRWSRASSRPAWCWRGGSDPARDTDSCRSLCYLDLEELLAERGIQVDHATINS
jgi:Phosphotransferase enzyme family